MSYRFTRVSLPVYKGITGNTFLFFFFFLPEYNVSEELSTVGVWGGEILLPPYCFKNI